MKTFHNDAVQSVEEQVAAKNAEFNELFDYLEPPASEMEKAYRPHLFEVKNGYKRSRYAFGEALHTYWFWCLNDKQEKPKAAQSATFTALCELIGVERRSAYNIMEDYKRAKTVHADFRAVAEKLNIDLAERRNADLVALLVHHPDLPREGAAEKALAVFKKAQQNVAATKEEREEKLRQAQVAESKKSRASKLYEFVETLYAGEPVDTFRKDMDDVTKRIAHYMRSGDCLPTLDELRQRRQSEAKQAA